MQPYRNERGGWSEVSTELRHRRRCCQLRPGTFTSTISEPHRGEKIRMYPNKAQPLLADRAMEEMTGNRWIGSVSNRRRERHTTRPKTPPVTAVFIQNNSRAARWIYIRRFLFVATQNIDLLMMMMDPPRTGARRHRRPPLNLIRSASLTFLPGLGSTAPFENVGQNEALKRNKLRQFASV